MHTLNEMVLMQPLNTPKPKKGAIKPLTLKGGGANNSVLQKGAIKNYNFQYHRQRLLPTRQSRHGRPLHSEWARLGGQV